jgi:hypothetical protein
VSCRRAFDLDLVACLLDGARPEWREFRDHYPRCPECAAEVCTWTELQASLAPPHPEPEELARLEDEPAADRTVAAHVASCASCGDEFRALRAFEPDRFAAPAADSAPVPEPPPPRPPRRRRAWTLRGLLLHPAFAYGVAFAALTPVLAPRLAPFVREPRRVVERARQALEGRTTGSAPLPAAPIMLPTPAPAAPPEPVPAAAPAPPVPSAPSSAALGEWHTITLLASRETELARPEPGVVLRLAPPRSLPAVPAGLAWLRVRDAAGRRELREQQLGNPGSPASIRVHGAWLEPGSYRADLVLGDENRPVATARFRVTS